MASHATGDGGIPPRDAAQRGLKRIMTVGGAYGLRNYTVKDLRDAKGQRVLTETLPFSPEEAAAAEEAGIDTMKCRFDPANPGPAIAIRQAAPKTFMAASVPLVAAATADNTDAEVRTALRQGIAGEAEHPIAAAFDGRLRELLAGLTPEAQARFWSDETLKKLQIFLLRLAVGRDNGRSRGRAFVAFLADHFERTIGGK